jgi:ribonuclease P protein subunit RPR2
VAKRRDRGSDRDLAQSRLRILLHEARAEALAGRRDLADRYAQMAMALARKHQTGLGGAREVCRGCGAYKAGAAQRTRLSAGRIVSTCLRCGLVKRRPIRAGRGSPS